MIPCFNSRTLGRVRLHQDRGKQGTIRFNSRTLGRVRLSSKLLYATRARFQFTHPGKGATKSTRHTRSIDYQFQFTHPGKGATIPLVRPLLQERVSIHAPWEGCDGRLAEELAPAKSFNSRTLGRVRHFVLHSILDLTEVSIHAPWEGCD